MNNRNLKKLLKESGIRDINNIKKRYKKAKIYFHIDLDGITTAIAMKKYLENQGIQVVDAEVIQYGDKEFAIKKPEGQGDVMPVLVDFAHGKPMFVIHTDHHDSQVGVEKDTSVSFRHSRSNVETISQIISPKELFTSEDIFLISTVDSANFAENEITPKMVMNFIYQYDKDKSAKQNRFLMGLVVNKLILAYKNYPEFMEYLVMKAEPSLLSIFNYITKIAKDKGYATTDVMVKNQEDFLNRRAKEGTITVTGNIISQYDLGNMRKGSYDRYAPFEIYPDADFLVTGLSVGLVQASCNPFKKERSLKGVNLGEVKDEVLEMFRPELEKQILTYRIIKRIAERKANDESVGFTMRDMEALYGKSPSYKVDQRGNASVNGYDFILSNSGGHKCITNISGINFLYSGYDKPYVKDLPEEVKPIAFYDGSNKFVKDIQQKLLKFRKLSEKQIEMALIQINRENKDIEIIPQDNTRKSYTELVKDIMNTFVEILYKKVKNQ
jgi:hypothetical protein